VLTNFFKVNFHSIGVGFILLVLCGPIPLFCLHLSSSHSSLSPITMASSISLSLTSSSHLHTPTFSSSSSRLNPLHSFTFHSRITHKPLHLQTPLLLYPKIRSLRQEIRGNYFFYLLAEFCENKI